MRRRFTRAEVVEFFTNLDTALDQPISVPILGGSAMFAWVKFGQATQDVDTWHVSDAAAECLDRALDRMADAGQAIVPINADATRVAQLPEDFEDRLVPWQLGLTKLRLLVVEPHDLVLSKLDRWHEGDSRQVQELHVDHPLDLDTLLERYLRMRFTATWNERKVDGHFLECVEMLFGELAREAVHRQLAAHTRPY